MRISFVFFSLTALLLSSTGIHGQSASRGRSTERITTESVAVHLYPHELNSRDRLTDGPSERLFRLQDNTLMIWIDLEPDNRFTHPTAYVLISREGTRVEEGMWWPVLNGSRILYGQRNSAAVVSPFQVSGPDGGPVEVYFHSEALTFEDRLQDGPDGREIPIRCPSFLAWVDTLPGLFFAHPTSYVLIGVDKTVRKVNGEWWPELNGKMILYGTRGKYGVLFPFRLSQFR